jgi:hypothetical protein
MKKLIGALLAFSLTAKFAALPAYAEDETDVATNEEHADVAVIRIANYDLTEMPSIIKQFRKGDFFYDTDLFDIGQEYVDEKMSILSERNNIILPSFIDSDEIGAGDIEVAFDDTPGVIALGGTAGGYEFSLWWNYGEENIKGEKIYLKNLYNLNNYETESRIINGIEVTGIKDISYSYKYLIEDLNYFVYTAKPDFDSYPFKNHKYSLAETTQSDRCYFFFETPEGYFRLYVNGADNFDEVFESFGIFAYPLTNGFVDFGGKTYYFYNGEFLSGRYKIGGKRYFFDEDGAVAE